MKVLHPGYAPEIPVEWWHDLVFTCFSCRCVFQLNADEFAQITDTERDLAAFAACPTCGVVVVARRPSVHELRRLPRFAAVDTVDTTDTTGGGQ